MMESKVSKIITNTNRPLIVNFTNGCHLEGENLKTKILKDADNLIVNFHSETEDASFEGNVVDEGKNTFLIVKRKNSSKVDLIQVDPVILKPLIKQPNEEADTNMSNDKVSARELNKEFGSKKAKRVTEQHERMKMEIEHVRQQLQQTAADVEIDHASIIPSKQDENENTYRPPINREASTKEQVYDINKLIPSTLLSSLDDEANNLLEGNLDEFELRPIVKKSLLELQKSSSHNRIQKCEILFYVDCLLNFLSTSAKSITKTFKACTYSADMNQHILDNFSVFNGKSRTRPLSMRDKCVCYIIVLLAIALDYKISVEELTKEMKMGAKKLQEFGRVLAFANIGNFLVLKIPLPPPVISSADRKRKNR